MGEFLSKFFVDVSEIPDGFAGLVQVLFLGGAYGCILFNASHLISEGSELLLLVPSLAGVVGSVVLPVLGAVPDGAIVLFSGLGPDAQEQLQVGVGALAGSTIMLLTIPWCLSIFGGRVSLQNGDATYTRPRSHRGTWRKLDPPDNMKLTETGVSPNGSIAIGAKIMLLTACAYLTIQIPAFLLSSKSHKAQSRGESLWSLFGTILSIAFFVWYLVYQFRRASHERDEVLEDKMTEVRKKALRDGVVNLRGVMSEAYHATSGRTLTPLPSPAATGNHQPLIQAMPDKLKSQMKDLLRPFFHELDADKTGSLDHEEVKFLFRLLNENPTHIELETFMSEADTDGSGKIEFEEFCNAMIHYVHRKPSNFVSRISDDGGSGESDQEEESVPDDLAELSPEQQQYRIKLRALYMMCIGTGLVLLFSDPMVDVFSSLGKRSGIPGFYISFILAPLASNASELIASYTYSLKKTRKTITISLSALEGAACMNNSFCLAIFLALVYFRGLYWNFTAETISILFVEIVIAVFAMKKVMTCLDGIFIAALYPISICLVWVMQNVLHMS